MKPLMLKIVKLTLVAIAIVATGPAQAWQIITQNSDSTVWFGFASAAKNMLQQGWHPTAVDVHYAAWIGENTKLALCLVRKEGAFNIQAEVVYDKTWDWIADYANDNGYTVVDHDEYLKSTITEGQVKRYAAVLHKPNPFVNWFAYTEATTPFLQGFVAGNGGKIIDMDIEENGNATFLFGTIHFSNAYSGVTWNSAMAWADIGPYCTAHNKRLLDLSRRLDGKYCALFCDQKTGEVGKWGWFGNASGAWLENAQAQGWRVQKRNSLTAGGQTTYSGVLVRKI